MKDSDNNNHLRLENQVCFALYSTSNALTRAYRPFLEKLDLTYLQYMVMIVLWQEQSISVKGLGEQLNLDSGTLTPLLKRLDAKELVLRQRSSEDERIRIISLTDKGRALEEIAETIPEQMVCKMGIPVDELQILQGLCNKLLARIN